MGRNAPSPRKLCISTIARGGNSDGDSLGLNASASQAITLDSLTSED